MNNVNDFKEQVNAFLNRISKASFTLRYNLGSTELGVRKPLPWHDPRDGLQ